MKLKRKKMNEHKTKGILDPEIILFFMYFVTEY